MKKPENNIPLVSVIIPCFNVEDYVIQCVESVLPELESGFAELICVDDGSSDSTVVRIKDWINNHQHIKTLLLEQENRGAPTARNFGLKNSNGKWAKFLDADDFLLPGMLKEQVSMAEKEGCDVLAGGYKVIDSKGKLLRTVFPILEKDLVALMKTKFGITSSNLFLVAAVNKVGGWNVELKSSQEYDLMFNILKENGKLVGMNELVAVRLWREGSISNMKTAENWKRYCELRSKIFIFYKQTTTYTSPEIVQAYFEAIRFVYPYDSLYSIECFKNIPKDFHLKRSDVISSRYAFAFNVFGFRFAQFLNRLFFFRL